MIARAALAFVLSLPIFVTVTANASGGHALVLTMASTVPGTLQIFFDTGQGFSEPQSVVAPTSVSDVPRAYRFPIQPGRYLNFRVDPGTVPGRYDIRGAVVLAPDGSTSASIPLADLNPVHQLTTIERTAARLLVEATPASSDPQILYAPAKPLEIVPEQRLSRASIRRLALVWVAALLAVVIMERLLARFAARPTGWLDRLRLAAEAQPRAAIVAAALTATIVATYPVLFLGRSLVSPNNGSLKLLYDAVPGVPSSADFEVEDTRASDVSAALYAFVPYSKVQRTALLGKEWPLWNRFNAAGRPLWGQGQTFLLDPLHWLTLITPDPALGWDLKFIAHRFVFAVGIGLAAFVVTGSWLPAAIAAIGAPFVGVYAYRVNHPAVFSMMYASWVMLAWFLLARAMNSVERARSAILLTAATALVLVGSPPKEAIAALLGTCSVGGLTVLLSGGWRDRMWRLAAAAVAGGVTALITAPHWLVFLDTLRLSRTNYDQPYAEFGRVAHAVALFLGPMTAGAALPGLHALALVMVLALVSAPGWVLQTRAVLACTLVTAAFVAVAFGVVPAQWLFKVPFIANVGHVHDVFITAAVPLFLILTAAGAVVLLSAGMGRALVVTALVATAAWWLVRRVAELAPVGSFEPWAAFLVLVLALMLPGCLGRFRRGDVLPVVAAAAVVVVLILPGGLHASSGMPALDALLVQPRARVSLDANSPAVDSIHRETGEPTRTVGVEWTLFSGSHALYEIEGIGGPDALVVRNYEELVDAAGIWRSSWLTRVGSHDVVRLAPLLDLLNVGFLLSAPQTVPPGFAEVQVSGQDRLKVGRRITAWPRAFFVNGLSTYADASDLLRKIGEHAGPFAAVQLNDRAAITAAGQMMSPSGDAIRAYGYRLSTNSTRFIVRAPGAGVAVLGETFLPNEFRATLNGRPVDYFRLNHVFKGIIVPSGGDWEVVFEYRPARWRLSWALAALGLVGIGWSRPCVKGGPAGARDAIPRGKLGRCLVASLKAGISGRKAVRAGQARSSGRLNPTQCAAERVLERHARLPSQFLVRQFDIQDVHGHVKGPPRRVAAWHDSPEQFFDRQEQLVHAVARAGADVEDAGWRFVRRRQAERSRHVANIDVVANGATIPPHGDLFATQRLVEEDRHSTLRGIASLSLAERIGEAEDGVCEPVQRIVQVKVLFNRELVDAVRAKRLRLMAFTDRYRARDAVHGAAGGGEHNSLDAALYCRRQEADGREQIRFQVVHGILVRAPRHRRRHQVDGHLAPS